MEDGWRKVSEHGGTLITSALYNIITGEETSIITRDYDYEDGRNDCDYWYNAPIDRSAEKAWKHCNGIISDGDRVMVIKGRKVMPGTVHTVERIRPIKDRYGRKVADYLVFEDGTSTNADNCIMVM